MVHQSVGYRPHAPPPRDLRVRRIRRPRRGEHAHRCRAGDDEPPARPAAAERHVRHPGRRPGAAAAGAAVGHRPHRQRRLPAAVEVLRPGAATRAAVLDRARGDARAHRPGRDRRRHDRAARGRAGRERSTCPLEFLQDRGVAHPPPAARARAARPGRRRDPRRREARSSSPAAACSTRAPRTRCARSSRPPASRSAPRRPAAASLAWDHPQYLGGIGATGTLAANRLAAEADVDHRHRHPLQRLHDRLAHRVPEPGRAVREHQRRLVRRLQARHAAAGRSPTPARRSTRSRSSSRASRSSAAYAERIARGEGEWDAAVDAAFAPSGLRCPASPRSSAPCSRPATRRTSSSRPPARCPGDLHKLWRVRDPLGYHVEYAFSCMGYEIAGGLGAKRGCGATATTAM